MVYIHVNTSQQSLYSQRPGEVKCYDFLSYVGLYQLQQLSSTRMQCLLQINSQTMPMISILMPQNAALR